MTTARKDTFYNNNIHVLHLASGDLWAGAEVMLYTLAKTLYRELNSQTSIVLLNHGTLEQKLRDCGVTVYVLDESRLNGFQILQQLNKIISELKPDVIHTHRFKENILGSFAAFIAGRTPCIRTVHGAPEHPQSRRKLIKRTAIYIDRLCGRFLQRRIIAVSEDLAGILENSLPSKKISVIENGIDQFILNDHDLRRKTRSDFRFGMAGRLVNIKRVDLFIQSAKYLKDNHPEFDASFHIYGDGPLRADLENLSNSLGTNSIVHFEGHCDDIQLALDEIDILVLTSDHEGLPMILLEAMCSNTPIIAHAVGGIPKLLDHGSCGILIREHTASGYANAMYQLATNPQLQEKFANKASLRVQSHYTSRQNALAYLAEYLDICNKYNSETAKQDTL